MHPTKNLAAYLNPQPSTRLIVPHHPHISKCNAPCEVREEDVASHWIGVFHDCRHVCRDEGSEHESLHGKRWPFSDPSSSRSHYQFHQPRDWFHWFSIYFGPTSSFRIERIVGRCNALLDYKYSLIIVHSAIVGYTLSAMHSFGVRWQHTIHFHHHKSGVGLEHFPYK
jgi:hypothetical protein